MAPWIKKVVDWLAGGNIFDGTLGAMTTTKDVEDDVPQEADHGVVEGSPVGWIEVLATYQRIFERCGFVGLQ